MAVSGACQIIQVLIYESEQDRDLVKKAKISQVDAVLCAANSEGVLPVFFLKAPLKALFE